MFRDLSFEELPDVPAFAPSAEFVSEVHAGGGKVDWRADVPEGCAVRFQWRGAASLGDLAKKQFAGPDGTSATCFDKPFTANANVMQYRVQLLSSGKETPVLREVSVGGKTDRDWTLAGDVNPPRARRLSPSPTRNSAETLRIEVVDKTSSVMWDSLNVTVDGADMTAAFRRDGDIISLAAPSGGWAQGLHTAKVCAVDFHGNKANSTKMFYVGDRPSTPKVSLRDDGIVLIDGKPFFPIGMYAVCKRDFNGKDFDVAFKGLKEAGFNLAHTYGNSYAPDFLAAAAKYGFKLWVAARFPDKRLIDEGRHNSSIIAWYLGDDTSDHILPELEADYDEAVKAVDPTRITVQADPILHSNGGAYLDIAGSFTLTGMADNVPLAEKDNIVVKPYASFHTMWEIYDEITALAAEGDDDAATAKPYVVEQSMGVSTAGYNMPYLIVAKDSKAVTDWLALCEKAETEPEQVLADIEAGKYDDVKVPVLYSNIHSNEVAAVDAILEFAKTLVEDESISYKKLTALTEAGEAKVQEQREAQGLFTPQLVQEMTTYLGSIWPSDNSQTSGKVENFDSYYESENVTFTVDELLDDVFFLLVPEENVEGRMYVTRVSSNGFDLNRDNSFQVTNETQNMQKLIGTFNPVTFVELHGQVVGYQVEPCDPPHEPNVEYDLLSKHLMTGGEAFGAAAVANNDDYQSYVIPERDYLVTDENGDPWWSDPWDDMSTSYTPQFAMLHGCVAYTVEMPAYSESARIADTFGMIGLSDYVAAEKLSYLADEVAVYARGVKNANSDAQVGPWYTDEHDVTGAEADLFRPAYDGEGENGQFFPEAYLIPLDAANQVNLQAAYDMVEWLTRNDVKVGVTSADVTVNGVTYPAGTAVVSMYQAKRGVANGALYDGTVITGWTTLYSEGITAFNYTRGFDEVIVTKPADYKTVAAAVGTTLDYDAALAWLDANAGSQFSGDKNGDVIISNASEDSTAAVNALLQAGATVGMITEGDCKGDFIVSYADWQSVCGDYVLTGTGVVDADVAAFVIGKAPVVYISGTASALTKSSSGYVNVSRVNSAGWNYDRWAMNLMGFATTTDAAAADAVVGATALDSAGLAAVQNGATYVGYTSSAVNMVSRSLLDGIATGRVSGMDCLGYVTYPTETLTNASYIADGDDVFYGYGTTYFTAVPDGSQVLVKRDGTKEPLEGFLRGDISAFLDSIQGFSYVGADKNGNNVNVTLFANTLTQKVHQRDEFAFISNALFAGELTDQAYETASPVDPTPQPCDGGDNCPSKDFVDVDHGPASWSHEAIDWAVVKEITKGKDAAHFDPEGLCQRAEAVTCLYRAAGEPEVTLTENPFTSASPTTSTRRSSGRSRPASPRALTRTPSRRSTPARALRSSPSSAVPTTARFPRVRSIRSTTSRLTSGTLTPSSGRWPKALPRAWTPRTSIPSATARAPKSSPSSSARSKTRSIHFFEAV